MLCCAVLTWCMYHHVCRVPTPTNCQANWVTSIPHFFPHMQQTRCSIYRLLSGSTAQPCRQAFTTNRYVTAAADDGYVSADAASLCSKQARKKTLQTLHAACVCVSVRCHQSSCRHSSFPCSYACANLVQVLLREEALIRAMAERYASGAAALKAKKWRLHETTYAERLQELAEREKVRWHSSAPACSASAMRMQITLGWHVACTGWFCERSTFFCLVQACAMCCCS